MSTHYIAEISEGKKFDVIIDEEDNISLDGQSVSWDVADIGTGSWHVLHDNKSYNIQLVSLNTRTKQVSLLVNDELFEISLKNDLDKLLGLMGMETEGVSRMDNVKAPMPGLVLRILVTDGQAVMKGDALVILEAMKMENVIKATGDGVVKKISVKNQDAVEKNQVLIEME